MLCLLLMMYAFQSDIYLQYCWDGKALLSFSHFTFPSEQSKIFNSPFSLYLCGYIKKRYYRIMLRSVTSVSSRISWGKNPLRNDFHVSFLCYAPMLNRPSLSWNPIFHFSTLACIFIFTHSQCIFIFVHIDECKKNLNACYIHVRDTQLIHVTWCVDTRWVQ